MSTTDAVLDYIDTVLRDCAVSGDAMRWAPGRVICSGGRPLMPELWTTWRHGSYSYRVTELTVALQGVTETVAFDGLEMSFEMTPGPGTKSWPPSQADLDRIHRAMVDYLGGMAHRSARRHRLRCHRCCPYGQPAPARGHFKAGPKAARIRGRRK